MKLLGWISFPLSYHLITYRNTSKIWWMNFLLDDPESKSTKETWTSHSSSWKTLDSLKQRQEGRGATMKGLKWSACTPRDDDRQWKKEEKTHLSLNGDHCSAVRHLCQIPLGSMKRHPSQAPKALHGLCFMFTRMFWNIIYVGCRDFFCLQWKEVAFKMHHHVLP